MEENQLLGAFVHIFISVEKWGFISLSFFPFNYLLDTKMWFFNH
jgi:hypothetical protein